MWLDVVLLAVLGVCALGAASALFLVRDQHDDAARRLRLRALGTLALTPLIVDKIIRLRVFDGPKGTLFVLACGAVAIGCFYAARQGRTLDSGKKPPELSPSDPPPVRPPQRSSPDSSVKVSGA